MATKEQRQKRLENGCCTVCGKDDIDGENTCDSCRLYHNEYVRKRRLKLIDKHLCPYCGKQPLALGLKRCKECNNKRVSSSKKYRPYQMRYRQSLRQLVLNHYGYRCVCCGENELIFLTIDHINNDGAEHRKQLCKNSNVGSVGLYRWLKKNNFPDGFQILCYNCNIGKYRNGGVCPHESGV